MQTVSFPAKSQIEGDNQMLEMSGERHTSEAHKHFLGIELTYLDHRTRTQETGVILFRPDFDFASILNVVAQINNSIKSRSHTMTQEKEEFSYTLGEKNPLEILGISNLDTHGRNSSTPTLTGVTKMTQTKKRYILVVFIVVVIFIIIAASQG